MNAKRVIGFLLAAVMMLMPMTVFAEDVPLGEADNPYRLSTMDMRFAVYVEPGATAWYRWMIATVRPFRSAMRLLPRTWSSIADRPITPMKALQTTP